MSTTQTASTIAALEAQRLHLELIVVRLEHLRRQLIPNPSDSWYGQAQRTFNTSVECLSSTVDLALGALHSARMHTCAAISTMSHRV
jgi:hypothetical protein